MRKRSSWLILFLVVWLSVVASAQTKIVQGPQGPRGFTGARGPAATVQIGTVTVVDANTPPTVTNVGTSTNAIFNFTIPRGGQILSGAGAPGGGGSAGDWWFDTTNACLYGPKTTLWPATCTNLGTTVAVGVTTTLPSGSSATVTNTGTSGHAVLNFGIPAGPQGDPGDVGPQGPSGTASVGSVTTLPPGSLATVNNSGSPSAAVFDFGIPKGDQGPQGPPGGSLTGLIDVTTTIQAAIDTACAATPNPAVHIPGNWTKNETYNNTCGTVVWDQRQSFNNGSGVLNPRTFGADGNGSQYVNMTTSSASKTVSACNYNLAPSAIVGKYLHVMRAGPGGGIFKSLITAASGNNCTVADFPTASVTAAGFISSNDDDGPAIQKAIDQAKVYGGKVSIPPGDYFINVDNSPLVLPLYQTATAPWNWKGVEIECQGGPQSTRLFGVTNKLANQGPPHAIIEGPRTTVVATAWSQSGTTVTITANNTFSNGDFISVWTPTGTGAVNGDTPIASRTATTITYTSIDGTSATASATETGSVWRAEKPMTPWIHGCNFETLDYPYGAKTGTALLDGIDMRAYVFKVDDNYFGNVDEGIRMYRSWLGTINNNRFYGPNIGIHFPRSLGPINATLVGWNWGDAYGKYFIFAEANNEGGSYGNQYIHNEAEGTSVKTLADFRLNGGGITFKSGYTEISPSWTNEASYHTLIIDGYGNFEFTFPYCIKNNGSGGTTIQQSGGASCDLDHAVSPSLTVNAGAGTFPAGRDVYIRLTLKDNTGWETPYYTGYSTVPKITNTALNDQVSVTASNWTDSTGTITQYCVYESDVATAAAAPLPETFRFVACTAKGSPTLVNAAPGTGAYLKPNRPGFNSTVNDYSTFIGADYKYDSTFSYNSTTGWANSGTHTYLGGPQGMSNGQIQTIPYTIGGMNDFPYGQINFMGKRFSAGNLANTNPNYPQQQGANAVFPFGMLWFNNYLYYAPANPLSHNLWLLCNVSPKCSNPPVGSEWLKGGYFWQKEHTEVTYSPSHTTVAGDWHFALGPSTWKGALGWVTFTGGAGGGTNYPFATAGNFLIQNKSFSATPTFDPSTVAGGSQQGDGYKVGGNYFKMTLTANVTSSTFQNGLDGSLYAFELCQNGTGGFTFVWPTQFKGAGTISPVANSCSYQLFAYDGTNAVAVTPMYDLNGKVQLAGSTEGLAAVTFSATPTFDAKNTNNFKITLTGNVTSSTLSNAAAGQNLRFIICQDATGSRTFVWPTNVKGATTIGSTLSTCTAQSFLYDGTNAYALGAGVTNQ